MKLQHIATIFALIIIPVSMVFGYYIQSEVDTLKLQAKYDEKLITAVSDSVKAYQINTSNNQYATINVSQKRDIEASFNVFINSFATGLGVGGYGEAQIKSYVPAMLFTLYDGYYIYAPTLNTEKNRFEHMLRPYFTYTGHYKNDSNNIDVLISYTLDNYITVIGTINGTEVNKSGFLINDNVSFDTEELKEYLYIEGESSPKEFRYVYPNGNGSEKYYYDTDNYGSLNGIERHWFQFRNGNKQYYSFPGLPNETYINDSNAKKYAEEAMDFTNWVKTNLSSITIGDLVLVNNTYENEIYRYGCKTQNDRIFDPDKNQFESDTSIFNIHKNDIIRVSIKDNLSSAITYYNSYFETSGMFQMPVFEESEWNKITKNVCMIAFVQGMPIGFKTYNNYAIVVNTKNSSYTDRNCLVFINSDDPNSNYHKIDCPYLRETNIVGYREIDFDIASVEVGNPKVKKYYYKHTNLPCYYCVVSRNYVGQNSPVREQAMLQALARERRMNTFITE